MVTRQYKKIIREVDNVESEETHNNVSDIFCNSDNNTPEIKYKSRFDFLASSGDDTDSKISIERSECVEEKVVYPIPKNDKRNSNRHRRNAKIQRKTSLSAPKENTTQCCLKMNKSFFNCNNEISYIFGNKIVRQSIDKKSSSKNRYLNLRRYFVEGDPQWPHLSRNASGMIMDYNEEKNEFTISFDINYLEKKEIFDVLVNSMLLDDIFVFMENNPFFFKGLIKLAEINMLRKDHENAFKFIQKAMYVFESSLNPSFSPFTCYNGRPKTHINSSELESRDVYITIGYYMNYLGFRGLFRTALEYCILLISMDIPLDRFHSLLHIDFFAISSSSFERFIDINDNYLPQFCNLCTWNTSKIYTNSLLKNRDNYQINIPLYYILPNFSFGVPLSLYTIYIKAELNEELELLNDFIEKIRYIDIDQILNTEYDSENRQDCSIYLMQSLLVFPEFISFFTKKLKINLHGLNYDENNLTWDVMQEFFENNLGGTCPIDDSIDTDICQYPYLLVGKLLVEANVEKCYLLWKKSNNIKWLHACCCRLYMLFMESNANQQNIMNFVENRRTLLLKSRFNIFRYIDVSISEFSDNPTLPAYFRNEDIEPTPNANSQNPVFGTYSSDPIFLFFQSLLPWYTHNGVNAVNSSLNLKELVIDCFISLKNYMKKNIISRVGFR